MCKSVYVTQFDGDKVEVHLAEMNRAKYTVIIIRGFNDGPNLFFPTLYLPKAPRGEREIFLKTNGKDSQAVNDMLQREGIVELKDKMIEAGKNGYAQVAELTDKAIQIRDGYIIGNTGKPDEIPDAEFN